MFICSNVSIKSMGLICSSNEKFFPTQWFFCPFGQFCLNIRLNETKCVQGTVNEMLQSKTKKTMHSTTMMDNIRFCKDFWDKRKLVIVRWDKIGQMDIQEKCLDFFYLIFIKRSSIDLVKSLFVKALINIFTFVHLFDSVSTVSKWDKMCLHDNSRFCCCKLGI